MTPMHIQFLGGATTVTGSQFLLVTERARVLIDCGMFQGSPNESIRNRMPFAYEPDELDAVLLTHAHLDHCGLLPLLVKSGYRGRIHATAGTIELATLVLLDSGKLHEEFAKRDARWEKHHPDKVAADDRRQADQYEAALELARGRRERRAIAGGIDRGRRARPRPRRRSRSRRGADRATGIRPRPSGADRAVDLAARPGGRAASAAAAARDRPGRAAVHGQGRRSLPRPVRAARLRPGGRGRAGHPRHVRRCRAHPRLGDHPCARHASRKAARNGSIVFSGDLGRPGTPILRDPTPMADADYVLVESTYGGREHEPEAEAIRILAETVRMVADAGGVLLVPSFAIGRTQEVVWELDRLIERGEIPLLPLYLDSPMASKASDVYRHHPDYYDEETAALLRSGETPLDYPNQIITNDIKASQAIARAPRPYMIVASNGMLTGGRVVGHLRNLIDDPTATILFVGYQGEGTLGAHLQAGATEVKLDGQVRRVRCQVRSISGFSAHADESELLDWLGHFAAGKQPGDPGYPRRVFLVHGDPEGQLALEPKVRALGFATHVPHWHERVDLD